MNFQDIMNELNKIETTKSQIKQAIIDKGQSISDSDAFATYASKISQIQTGTPIHNLASYDLNLSSTIEKGNKISIDIYQSEKDNIKEQDKGLFGVFFTVNSIKEKIGLVFGTITSKTIFTDYIKIEVLIDEIYITPKYEESLAYTYDILNESLIPVTLESAKFIAYKVLNNINKASVIKKHDITGDEKLNKDDLKALENHLNDIEYLEGDKLQKADIFDDGDNQINMKDFNRLYNHLNGVNSLFVKCNIDDFNARYINEKGIECIQVEDQNNFNIVIEKATAKILKINNSELNPALEFDAIDNHNYLSYV